MTARPSFATTLALVLAHAAMASAQSPAAASTIRLVTAAEPGTPLVIAGRIMGTNGQPVPGARLHIYQTDATGRYTPDKPMDEPHARLNGRLVTDSAGRFEIHTIRPGGYPQAIRLGDRDRHIPAHVHIDIQAAGKPERKLQVIFSDDPNLADPYWVDWARKLREPIVTATLQGSRLTARLVVTLD